MIKKLPIDKKIGSFLAVINICLILAVFYTVLTGRFFNLLFTFAPIEIINQHHSQI